MALGSIIWTVAHVTIWQATLTEAGQSSKSGTSSPERGWKLPTEQHKMRTHNMWTQNNGTPHTKTPKQDPNVWKLNDLKAVMLPGGGMTVLDEVPGAQPESILYTHIYLYTYIYVFANIDLYKCI